MKQLQVYSFVLGAAFLAEAHKECQARENYDAAEQVRNPRRVTSVRCSPTGEPEESFLGVLNDGETLVYVPRRGGHYRIGNAVAIGFAPTYENGAVEELPTVILQLAFNDALKCIDQDGAGVPLADVLCPECGKAQVALVTLFERLHETFSGLFDPKEEPANAPVPE